MMMSRLPEQVNARYRGTRDVEMGKTSPPCHLPSPDHDGDVCGGGGDGDDGGDGGDPGNVRWHFLPIVMVDI